MEYQKFCRQSKIERYLGHHCVYKIDGMNRYNVGADIYAVFCTNIVIVKDGIQLLPNATKDAPHSAREVDFKGGRSESLKAVIHLKNVFNRRYIVCYSKSKILSDLDCTNHNLALPWMKSFVYLG